MYVEPSLMWQIPAVTVGTVNMSKVSQCLRAGRFVDLETFLGASRLFRGLFRGLHLGIAFKHLAVFLLRGRRACPIQHSGQVVDCTLLKFQNFTPLIGLKIYNVYIRHARMPFVCMSVCLYDPLYMHACMYMHHFICMHVYAYTCCPSVRIFITYIPKFY